MNAPLTCSWDDLSCGRNNSALEPRLVLLLVGEKLGGITTLWSCHLQGTETGSGTDSGIVGLGNGSLEHWMSAPWASEAGAGERGWAVRGTVVRLARRGVELEENLPRLNPKHTDFSAELWTYRKGERIYLVKVCWQVLGSASAYVGKVHKAFCGCRWSCVRSDKLVQVKSLKSVCWGWRLHVWHF